MRRGLSRTTEAAGLATRMANHFGHKCEVERDGEVTRIHTRVGTIVLIVQGDELEVQADAGAAEVAERHLERFARETFELVWTD